MNVLIACEESQEVCKAFRDRGHRAFSCDLQECSGGHPEWHIQGDVLPVINGDCTFQTADKHTHTQTGPWDLIIAHPPCTYLTVTGNSWFSTERYGKKAEKRWANRVEATVFFMQMALARSERVAVENPVGIMSTCYRKPDQIIHPYYFGDPAKKATCLWLKGLKPLEKTNEVEPVIAQYKNRKGTDNPWHMETMKLPPAERSKARSKTFPGIAKAMAEQWG